MSNRIDPCFSARAARQAAFLAALLLGLSGTALAASAPAASTGCNGQAGCTEVRTFTATVTNFRATKQGADRVVVLTVRFRNRTDKPLTLGYVNDSGTIMDDKGNRYVAWGPSAVRAIGIVTGSTFDPKFTLQPGESSDARFELVWRNAGNTIAGTLFDLDLAVREVVAVAEDQFKLGSEHALHYSAISDSVLSAANKPAAAAPAAPTPAAPAAGSSATASAATAAPAAAAPPADPCAGAANCYNAGAFVAHVQQVVPTQFTPAGRHHSIKMNMRFTNTSGAPVVLAYKGGSSSLTDNLGNVYVYGRPGTHDTSVKGMGYVTGRTADAQFVLNPGQSRSATFNVVRFNAREPIGNGFQYDLVINELEILGSTQVRTVRENSLSFAGLRAGSFNVAQIPGLPAMPEGVGDEATVAQKVIDLFNSVKKK